MRLEVTGGKACDAIDRGTPPSAAERRRERRAGRGPERRRRHVEAASPRTSAAAWRRSAPVACGSAAASTSAWASWPRRAGPTSPGRLEFGQAPHARLRRDLRCCPPAPAPRRSSASTASAERRPPSCPPSTRSRTTTASSPSTCPASASPTSRSARPTTRPGSRARCSRRWTRSASSARTSRATAWAAGWRSRRASRTATGPARCSCSARRWRGCARARGRRCCARCARSSALIQPAPRPIVEAMVRAAGALRERRLDRGGHRRVPARLPHAQRARGLLRGGAQHLPRRAARRRGLLDPARVAPVRLAVRLGPAGHARADRLHEARRAGAAERPPRGAALRPRATGRAAARDARGDQEVPGRALRRRAAPRPRSLRRRRSRRSRRRRSRARSPPPKSPRRRIASPAMSPPNVAEARRRAWSPRNSRGSSPRAEEAARPRHVPAGPAAQYGTICPSIGTWRDSGSSPSWMRWRSAAHTGTGRGWPPGGAHSASPTRGAVTRVEEARRAALRRLAAGQLLLRGHHGPAALLERGRHRLDVLGALRAVERLLGLGVALHRLVVVLLALAGRRPASARRGRARGCRRPSATRSSRATCPHVLELAALVLLLALALAAPAERERAERQADQEHEEPREAAAPPSPPPPPLEPPPPERASPTRRDEVG